ncbi:hypothetical protein [Cerasicoccus frondis]|uniref:hypothetical protein n=1 Tax=Cerasicoccus frondis TaxID=490090 RepID=UPI0028529879|nr:hypothetical protein [Cerasicoccus frondis]
MKYFISFSVLFLLLTESNGDATIFGMRDGETYALKIESNLLLFRIETTESEPEVNLYGQKVFKRAIEIDYRFFSLESGLSDIQSDYCHDILTEVKPRRYETEYSGFSTETLKFLQLRWHGLSKSTSSFDTVRSVDYISELDLALEDIQEEPLKNAIKPGETGFHPMHRLWMNNEGLFLEAKYLSQTEDMVIIRNKRGDQWKIPKESLSEYDRGFLELILAYPEFDPRGKYTGYAKKFMPSRKSSK